MTFITGLLSAILLLVAEVRGAAPVRTPLFKFWGAADATNSSACTNVVVQQGYAIVGTRGPQLIGKLVDEPEIVADPPMPDWNITLNFEPQTVVPISATAVVTVTNDTVGAYGSDGKPLWNYTLNSTYIFVTDDPSPVVFIPDMVRGIGYIGSTVNSDDCVPAPVTAINLTTGEQVWQQLNVPGLTNTYIALSSHDEALYVPSNAADNTAYGILRLNSRTGAVVWDTALNASANVVVIVPNQPNIIVVYDTNGHLIYLDALTGHILPSKKATVKSGDGVSVPIFDNNTLYFRAGAYATAISTVTWENIWDHKIGGSSIDSMLVDDVLGGVVVCGYGHADFVNSTTKEPTTLMTPTPNGNDDMKCHSIHRVSHRAIALAFGGGPYLVDITTRTLMAFDEGWVSGPAVWLPNVRSGLLVYPNDGAPLAAPIQAMHAASLLPSSQYWTSLTDFEVLDPQLDNTTGQVIWGMDTDRFYAFNLPTGTPNWTIPTRISVFYMGPGLSVTETALCAVTGFHLWCVNKWTGKPKSRSKWYIKDAVPMRIFQNRYVAVTGETGIAVIDTSLSEAFDGSATVSSYEVSEMLQGSISRIEKMDEWHYTIIFESIGSYQLHRLQPGSNSSAYISNWTIPSQSRDGASITCPPVFVGANMIVTGDTRNTLYAIDRRSGKLLWQQIGLTTPCSRIVVTSSPLHAWRGAKHQRGHDAVSTTALYVMTPSGPYRIDPATGNILWTGYTDLSQDLTSRVDLFEDSLLVHADSGAYSFNGSTGALNWVSYIVGGASAMNLHNKGLAFTMGNYILFLKARTGVFVGQMYFYDSGAPKVSIGKPAYGFDGQEQVGTLVAASSSQPAHINVLYGVSIPPFVFEE